MQKNRADGKEAFDKIDSRLQTSLRACEDSFRIHFANSWKEKTKSHDAQELMQFINPGYAKEPNKTELIKKNLLAPEKSQKTDELRALSKYRLITSDVVLLNQTNFPTVSLMTIAAPNLMGTSPEDLATYANEDQDSNIKHKKPIKSLHGGGPLVIDGKTVYERKLTTDKYKEICREQADLICSAAIEQGKKKIIMPDFGLGVYLRCLSKESQEDARQIMLSAFQRAATYHKINIEWIIWENDPDHDKKFSASKDYGSGRFKIVSGDLLKEMDKAANNKDVVFVNPGSDRTIGGAFEVNDPKTLEEQIAQTTSLVITQSACFNPEVEKQYNMHMDPPAAHLGLAV